MYAVEKFNERLGNATTGMIDGRPYLWDKLGEFDTIPEAVQFAGKQPGNVRITGDGMEYEIRGSRDIALAAEAIGLSQYPAGEKAEDFIRGWIFGPGIYAADPSQDHINFMGHENDANTYRKIYGLS